MCSTKVLVRAAMILLLVCPLAYASTRAYSETTNESRKDLADMALIILDTDSVREMKASIRFIEGREARLCMSTPHTC